MVKTISVAGEQIIYGKNGALVASKSQPGAWHVVKLVGAERTCDCRGFAYRQNCRHVRAVEQYEKEREAKKTERTLPPRTRDNAPLAGPPIDAPIFGEDRPAWTPPKSTRTFEQMFPEYA